ncbi:MAG: thiazole synthase [Planctomycetes bacterium]|nr:thiazole synthase [Planctomycetota bacterium]
MNTKDIPPLTIGRNMIKSRLILGTGKYANFELMNAALEAAGVDVVTVAIRRIDFKAPPETQLTNHLDTKKYKLLPNTAACFNAEDAVRIARMSRELGMGDWVKLEVLSDPDTLLPDPFGTLEATKILVAEGFDVLVYTSDDPVMAMRLEDAGAAAVMPAGSPIGSGQGVLNENSMHIILEKLKVPVIIDAGVGTASDVTRGMELGAAGILMNTAVAGARDPEAMASAMGHAWRAGYLAARAGRIPRRRYASASSPMKGLPGE